MRDSLRSIYLSLSPSESDPDAPAPGKQVTIRVLYKLGKAGTNARSLRYIHDEGDCEGDVVGEGPRCCTVKVV